MSDSLSRRRFLAQAALGSAGAMVLRRAASARSYQANERISLALVGCTGRGQGFLGPDVVALCDVDSRRAAAAFKRFPDVPKFEDFRVMLDKMGKQIDAVIVCTPDHTHAAVTAASIRAGKHVYCEKPLTHDVWEARQIRLAAAEAGVTTQMGIQIHAGENYRRVVEVIQSGAIGKVNEVHVWVGKAWGGGERPEGSQEPPATLDWDLWLGPAPERPFWPGVYHPANWRRWWDFGTGTLGDMACHYMDLPFWALNLRHPVTCQAEGPEVHPETCPLGLIVRYEFPEREGLPPVQLTWYDGNLIPKEIAGQRVPGSGVMFIGEEGMMFADYGSYRLFPAEKFADFKPPAPSIAPSIGHHAEWIKACKDGSPTTCNFDYSGPLSEAVILGTVAYRTGERLQWDAKNLKATNCPAADKYVNKPYRAGWEVA